MLVTLITCTGGRDLAFALCQHYVARQTYKDAIQWIVVNDTETPLQIIDEIQKEKRISVEIYQGPKLYRPGINTQHFNMDEAIKHVKGDYIFTFEDDDMYAPDYIETQLFLLQHFDIVGECHSRYYNVKERIYKDWTNYAQASLNETAMRKSKLDLLDRAVNSGQLFFDMMLWSIVRNEKHKFLLYDNIGLVVGIKGMPGKVGIGSGHTMQHDVGGYTKDPFFEKLREWCGLEYAKPYMSIKWI